MSTTVYIYSMKKYQMSLKQIHTKVKENVFYLFYRRRDKKKQPDHKRAQQMQQTICLHLNKTSSTSQKSYIKLWKTFKHIY